MEFATHSVRRARLRQDQSRVPSRAGFTLVELLVVIAIIGILVALLLPAVQAARESARRTQCVNQLKQWSLACMLHHDTHNAYPTGGWLHVFPTPRRRAGADPNDVNARPAILEEQNWGWMYQVLPYIENGALWESENDLFVTKNGPGEAVCPSRRQLTYTTLWYPTGGLLSDYSGNGGDTDTVGNPTLGVSPVPKIPRQTTPPRHTGVIITQDEDFRNSNPAPTNPLIAIKHVTDGTSNTMLLGEKYVPSNLYQGGAYGDNFAWVQGAQWEGVRFATPEGPKHDDPIEVIAGAGVRDFVCNNCDLFGSPHPGGFNASLCDGSVRSVSYDINVEAYQALANRLDGLILEE